MQNVVINFRQVIFSNASSSGLKSELIIRWWLHAFVVIFNAVAKSFMRKVLTKYKLCFGTDSGKMRTGNHWGVNFWFAPFKIYLITFCKAFRQKSVHQIKWILWFFGLKTCKDDSYMQKENLFIKNVLENHVLLLLKTPVTVEWFLSPNILCYFCYKSKGYLGLNQSLNLEIGIFLGLITIKKWKAFS